MNVFKMEILFNQYFWGCLLVGSLPWGICLCLYFSRKNASCRHETTYSTLEGEQVDLSK